MKVSFTPYQFRSDGDIGNISVEGTFRGSGVDFLAVMARLYQMPFLWFSEGIYIELDFVSENLTLMAYEDKGKTSPAKDINLKIPFKELMCLSTRILRDKYIRTFVANLAENNFGMLKTAEAIRQGWKPSLISELAAGEGHPVLDSEIENLLFRENWEIETSYEKCCSC